MKIYFSGAVRGGRALQPQYVEIVKILKQYGEIISEHVTDENITKYGETDLTKEEIHNRELERLEHSDIMVAEVTTPSLGVGYLIAQALIQKKDVICLYHGENTYELSAMIKGNQRIKIETYQETNDLPNLFAKMFKELEH